ncbi:MAG: PAS domain S-box protein, partial [Desulfuromonadales bacterium]|nr:PAS domain S-box protein [Desulfuromonadales bacterium]
VQVYETRLPGGKGEEERCVIAFKAPFPDSEGKIVGLVGTLLDITERKQFERELASQRELSENLLQNSPAASFVLDRQHRVTQWNRACEELTGVRATDILGTSDHWRAFYPHQRPCLADAIIDGDLEVARSYYPGLSGFRLNARGVQAEGWFPNLNGERRYLIFHAAPICNSEGEVVAAVETLQELTDRKLVEEALLTSQERLRAFFDSGLVGTLFGHIDGRILQANDEFLRLTGYNRGDLEAGLRWDTLTPAEFLPLDRQAVQEAQQRGACTPYEKQYRRQDGSCVWALVGFVLVGEKRDESVAFILDLTERKQMEQELQRSRDFYLTIFEEFPALIWRAGLNGQCDYFNKTWLDFTGRPLAEEVGDGWTTAVHPDDLPGCLAIYRDAFRERRPFSTEYRLRRFDGEYRWIANMGRPFNDLNGRFAGFTGASFDITERRQTLEQLKILSRSIEQSTDAVIITDASGHIEYVNPEFTRQTGYPPEEARGFDIDRLLNPGITGGLSREEYRLLLQTLLSGQTWQGEFLNRSKDGHLCWNAASISPIQDSQGEITHFVAVMEDMTETKKTQESQYRRRVMREAATESLHTFLQTSSHYAMAHVLLSSCLELLQAPLGFIADTEGDNFSLLALAGPAYRQDEKGGLEARIRQLLGQEADAPAALSPALEGVLGTSCYLVPLRISDRELGLLGLFGKEGGFSEIDRHDLDAFAPMAALALQSARTEQARQEATDRLRAVQKFEAIGQLAGGVVHDFNNLLTVITGYGSLLVKALEKDETSRQDAEMILQAGQKAETLTRQLLAFSRRQVLAPVVIDLNELIGNFRKLLLRLVPENIELHWALGAPLHRVKADPSQLEQILINLVVNSRDALPQGGQIVIETTDITLDEHFTARHPGARCGEFALLAVHDNGIGMSEEVRERIFEPFFTTKPLGRGTGLGLATVYGIVKQSAGYITVESRPQ